MHILWMSNDGYAMYVRRQAAHSELDAQSGTCLQRSRLAAFIGSRTSLTSNFQIMCTESAAAPSTGWSAGATRHFLLAGRPWSAVEDYFRSIVSGEQRDLLGLSLLDASPRGAAAAEQHEQSSEPGRRPLAKPAGHECEEAAMQLQQQEQQQLARPRATLQPQPTQQHGTACLAFSGPRTRFTFKVHLAYFGPSFRQAWGLGGRQAQCFFHMRQLPLSAMPHAFVAWDLACGTAGSAPTVHEMRAPLPQRLDVREAGLRVDRADTGRRVVCPSLQASSRQQQR